METIGMVEFQEEPEPEPELKIPAFLRKQAEDGNIKMEDRLRKHLFTAPDQPDKPRKKVFPARFTKSKEFTVPEVEVPEFLVGRGRANVEPEGTPDYDAMPKPIW